MRIYLDTSALLKRVIAEVESAHLVETIDEHHRRGTALVSSSLAWIETARALRNRADVGFSDVADHAEDALAGVLEEPIRSETVGLARRVRPNLLRSVDAIHLASALIVDADVVVTYDDRLASACVDNGLPVAMPGRTPVAPQTPRGGDTPN
jgi:predicted nucleic acid-binding protein